jgi:hypothetical protein
MSKILNSGIYRGFDYEETENGSYVISSSGNRVSTQPSLEAVTKWVDDKKSKDFEKQK